MQKYHSWQQQLLINAENAKGVKTGITSFYHKKQVSRTMICNEANREQDWRSLSEQFLKQARKCKINASWKSCSEHVFQKGTNFSSQTLLGRFFYYNTDKTCFSFGSIFPIVISTVRRQESLPVFTVFIYIRQPVKNSQDYRHNRLNDPSRCQPPRWKIARVVSTASPRR